MTPASQKVVSGKVLSEHVSRVLVCWNEVQSDLPLADFLLDKVEVNINIFVCFSWIGLEALKIAP